MNKLILLSSIILVCLSGFAATPSVNHHNLHARIFEKEAYVYICDSRGAYAYHSSKDCRGLNRCSHGILKVTLANAVKIYHRKPCKICE
jgi:hypothetical protein